MSEQKRKYIYDFCRKCQQDTPHVPETKECFYCKD